MNRTSVHDGSTSVTCVEPAHHGSAAIAHLRRGALLVLPAARRGPRRFGIRVRSVGLVVFGAAAIVLASARHAVSTPPNKVSARVRAIPPALMQIVPADCVAAYLYSPAPHGDQADGGRLGWAAGLLDQAQRIGLTSPLSTEARAAIDAAAAVPTLLAHPHALVLFRIAARPRAGGGHELEQLSAALIVLTHGRNDAVEQRIRHLLLSYTDRDTAELQTDERSTPAVPAGPQTVYTLRDRRLPTWAVIRWGPRDPYYVVTIGADAWERVSGVLDDPAKSLAHDGWFQAAFKSARTPHASCALFTRLDRLEPGADEPLSEKIASVEQAANLRDVQRAVFVLGADGEAVSIRAVLERPEGDESVQLAGSARNGSVAASVIPDAATGYTVIDVDPTVLLDRISEAYLAARSPATRRTTAAFWQGVESEAGVSVRGDIFSALDSPIVVHNFPPHALRLPGAWTVLIRVKGHAAGLQTRVDRFLDVARRRMEQAGTIRLFRVSPFGASGEGNPPSASVVQKDAGPDRVVWYLEYGLLGPALTVTDDWLVISFSPRALHENVKLLSAVNIRSGP